MSSEQREHMGGEESILRIHRLFDDPLPPDDELCPWYCWQGGVVDYNALLSIEDDSEFIEAAVWQIHGHETDGRQRQRWLRRLKRSSRTCLIIGMRYKSSGRRHAVKIPGLWFALLLNPPGHQVLGTGRARRFLHWLRQKIVAWRYERAVESSKQDSAVRSGRDKDRSVWRRAS